MVPVPVVVTAPGLRVRVQVPDAGNPLRSTLPVVTVQVGCVMVPIVGAGGMVAATSVTGMAAELQLLPVVTVNDQFLATSPVMV